MQQHDLTGREMALAMGITSKRRHDTSVKSTRDLREDGSESDDDSEEASARISVDIAGDCNKNKCRAAKNTAVASALCSETIPMACSGQTHGSERAASRC